MSYLPPHIISKTDECPGTAHAEDDASRFNVLRGAKNLVHQTAGAVQHVTINAVEQAQFVALNAANTTGHAVQQLNNAALNAANSTGHAVQHCANSTVGIVESTVGAVQHLGNPLQNYGTLSSQSEIAPLCTPSESTMSSSCGFDLTVFDVTSERLSNNNIDDPTRNPQWEKTSMQSLGELNRYVITGVGGVSSALAKGAASAAGGATGVVSSVGGVASTAVVRTASAVGNTASAVGNVTAAAVTSLLDTKDEEEEEKDKVDMETTRQLNQEERLQTIIAKRHDDDTLSKQEKTAELMNGCKASLQEVLSTGVSTDSGEGEGGGEADGEDEDDKESLCRKINENRLTKSGRVRRTHSPKRCVTSGAGDTDRVRGPTRSRSSTPRRCQSDAKHKTGVSRSRSTSPRRGDRIRSTRSRESSPARSEKEAGGEPMPTTIKSEHTSTRSTSPTARSRSPRGDRATKTTPRCRGNGNGSKLNRSRSTTRKIKEGDRTRIESGSRSRSRSSSRSGSRSRSASPTRTRSKPNGLESTGLESPTHQSATTRVRRSRSRSPASRGCKEGSSSRSPVSKGRGRSRSESPKRNNAMTATSNQHLHKELYDRPTHDSEEELPNFSLAVDIDDEEEEEEEIGETSCMSKRDNDDQMKMGMSTLLDESLKSNYDGQPSSSFGQLAEEEPMLLVGTL